MANPLRIRKAVHNLTADEVSQFRDAYRQMMAIRDNRGYAYFAGLHGVPGHYCWHNQHNDRIALQMRLFLPWHRAYLLMFEHAMVDRVGTAFLPWWDWTLHPPSQDMIPSIFAGAEADGQTNPLASFHMKIAVGDTHLDRDTARAPDPAERFPAQPDVDAVMARTDWADFSDALEDVHDQVHVHTGGDMDDLNIASYDPIFWSHHCMIDRIWWVWQVANGNTTMPAGMMDQVLAPFPLKVRDVLNVNVLGYEYAAASVDVPVGTT